MLPRETGILANRKYRPITKEGHQMSESERMEIKGQREEAIKWGGIPPAGENPITDSNKFVGKVLLTLAICIGIWTIYRAVGGQIFTGLHTNSSMITDFFAKPLFTVLPIIFLWRFLFKEKRAPVRFGRKNMESGIISALVLVSSFIFLLYIMQIIFFRMFGVMEAGSVSLIPGWKYMGTVEFILLWLMFVVSTGFAEEYEARGFLQDQLMRVQSPWKSILITALIFAAGHIPIFIFIHHLAFWQGFYYFVYLVPMSIFLSIYYHWSRNLPAVMIYHGLFDWMLSAIYITARYDASYGNSIHVAWGIFFIASLFAITINLALLYVFYRVFWKKDRPSGSMGFKIPIISDWKGPRPRRFRRDDSSISWGKTIFALGAASVLFSGFVMGFGAAFGTMDPSVVADQIIDKKDESKEVDLSAMDLVVSDISQITDYVGTGQTSPIPHSIVEENVVNVSFKLTWSDEADATFRHKNEPDTLTIEVSSHGGISQSESGANSYGQQGVIEFRVAVPLKENPSLEGTGPWNINITVVSGDHEASGPAALKFLDNGNSFTLEINHEYYQETE
jgi:membrane protease YdiL (CAAX protease family)